MNQSKEEKYQLLYKQVASVLDGEEDMIARMANTAAMLHETFHFWWTGFYRVIGHELVLGPFQGPVACTHIAYGRGVCGSAWQQRKTLVVPDVEEFPGHIACSSQSRSEIVVPIFSAGHPASVNPDSQDNIIAVLDIDSQYLNTFDSVDAHWLQQIAELIK